jgi:outer membrane immunogenic protein
MLAAPDGALSLLSVTAGMNSQYRDMHHMRKLLLTTAALVALTAGEGFGADISRPVLKAPPAPMQFTNWSGCHVAGGGGYGFWNQDTSASYYGNPVGSEVTSGGRGWFGTIGGGCDIQVSGSWVIGAFGAYDFGGIKGDVAVPINSTTYWGNEKLTSAWAVGGRVGYLITPSIMTYVSAGYTEARFGGADLFYPSAPPEPSGYSVPARTFSGLVPGRRLRVQLGLAAGRILADRVSARGVRSPEQGSSVSGFS